MIKSELLEKINDSKDDEDITGVVLGMEDLKNYISIDTMTLEQYKELLDKNKEIKGYTKSQTENRVTNEIKTWQDNNLQRLIDEGVKAKLDEDKTPEEIKVKALEDKIAKMEVEKVQATNKSNYTKTLVDKGLSADLVDFIYSDDSEVFNKNLEKISSIITAQVNNGVNSKLTNSSYTPPKNDSNIGKITWEQVNNNPSLMSDYLKQENK